MALHAELRAFSLNELRPCTTRVTTLLGQQLEEHHPATMQVRAPSLKTSVLRSRRRYVQRYERAPRRNVCVQGGDAEERRLKAAQRLAALRAASGKDRVPCKVADGLYIGALGAARNLKALRKAGITHVLNCSPAVPCFFRDHPNEFTYHVVPIFDDDDADLLAHLPPASAFIAAGRRAGGVLVHCYAGQSRSAAFVMGHLVECEGASLVDAFAAVRRARPAARPNRGFLQQLDTYASVLGQQPLGALVERGAH
jgi:protein phosphatase slingshot